MSEGEFTRLMLDAVRAATGRPVISARELYDRMTGGTHPQYASDDAMDLMERLLLELGYVERWVTRVDDEGTSRFMFVRDPWPNDHAANFGRRTAVYVPL